MNGVAPLTHTLKNTHQALPCAYSNLAPYVDLTHSGSESNTEPSPDSNVPQDEDNNPTVELGMWRC